MRAAILYVLVLVGVMIGFSVLGQNDTGSFDAPQETTVTATTFQVREIRFLQRGGQYMCVIEIRYKDAQGNDVALARNERIEVTTADFLAGTGVTPAQFYTRARNVAKAAVQQ
jgi:hypothetical protein